MGTEVPDILHNNFHVAYKYFTRLKIAKVPWITELERILYKQKNACLCMKTVKLIHVDYVLSISVYYLSLKNKKHMKIWCACSPKSCRKSLIFGSFSLEVHSATGNDIFSHIIWDIHFLRWHEKLYTTGNGSHIFF